MRRRSARGGRPALSLDREQCIGCAICADVCPPGALVMDLDATVPGWIDDDCNGCAICARQCPTEAITVTMLD